MFYYKRHIGDYLKDTAHLSLLEHGIYTRLIDVYYIHEGPLPDAQAARQIGARSQEERDALALVLEEFFMLKDGLWHHKRCEVEIAEYKAKEEKNRLNGKLGGRPKKTQQEPKRNPKETQMVSENNPNHNPNETQSEPKHNPNHKPLTINQEPSTKDNTSADADVVTVSKKTLTAKDLVALQVEQQVADDFLAMRKAKRAPLTQTALDGIKAEAAKASWSLEMALRECLMRGWQGFNAAWVTNGVQAIRPSKDEGRISACNTIGVGSQYFGDSNGQPAADSIGSDRDGFPVVQGKIW